MGKYSKEPPTHQSTWAAIRSLLNSIPHMSITEGSTTSVTRGFKDLDVSSLPAHQRPSPCSKCLYTPPILLINTTLVPQTGSAHSQWKIVRHTSHLQEYKGCKQLFKQELDTGSNCQDQEEGPSEHDAVPPACPAGLSVKNSTETNQKPMSHVANIAVQVSANLTNESTQVCLTDLEDSPPYEYSEDIIPKKKSPVVRGRGRGRRGRGAGGGRKKRGTRTPHLSDDSLQTRSFRPRKSTCYLELPDDDDDEDRKENSADPTVEEEDLEMEEKDFFSEKKLKKMRKRAHSSHQKSEPTESEETCEEGDIHGTKPFILKLAKRTDSGAEWKVETVKKNEEHSDPQKTKTEGQRLRAFSADDAQPPIQEQMSYSYSLSDSDIAKSPRLSSRFEDVKSPTCEDNTDVLPGSAASQQSPNKRKPRGPFSKMLIAKKRRMLMQPKKGGALFRKAMKVCSVRSKMQPSSSAKVQCPSPKEPKEPKETLDKKEPKEIKEPNESSVTSPIIMQSAKTEPLPVSGEDSKTVSKVPAAGEDSKPSTTRSAIFTLDNKGGRKKTRRMKERKRIDDTLNLSKGKYKCNRCGGHFQTQLAAKKHWLNFHHVPGGSTSPSRDISLSDNEPELSSYVPNTSTQPSTPPLPSLSSFQPLPPVPALHPIAPYAVPAPAPPIPSFCYSAFSTNSSEDASPKSCPKPQQKPPLDLPVRFLDTL